MIVNHFKLFTCIVMIAFCTKTNAQAISLDFARQYNGTGQSKINALEVDNTGNIYTGGSFNGAVDFDPGIGTSIYTGTNIINAFVSKLDNNGNFAWAKQLGGSATGTEVHGMALDASGNIYCTGAFIGTADLDPGPGTFTFTSGMAGDAFIVKLDASGNFIWAKVFSNAGGDNCGMSINIDGDGNIVSTGFFLGPLDFDPGPGTFLLSANSPLCNIYISKLDLNGNFIWAKQFIGSAGGDVSKQLTTDAFKNIFISGHFAGTVDFDPGPGTYTLTASGSKDLFNIKLDLNGNLLWVNSAGGSGDDGARSIDKNSFGRVLSAGVFSTTVDFDPGPGTSTLSAPSTLNGYIAEYNSSGSLLWVKQLISTSANEINSAIYDLAGNIYVAGTFSGTVDFDPGINTFMLSSNGDQDSYLLRLDPNGNFMWAFITGSANSERSYCIRSNQIDKVISAGVFGGACDFDPTPATFTMNPGGVNNSYITRICVNCANNINENTFFSGFNIYPNPSSDKITLAFKEAEKSELLIELMDISGRILMKKIKHEDELELHLTTRSYENGYYSLMITDYNGNKRNIPFLIIH